MAFRANSYMRSPFTVNPVSTLAKYLMNYWMDFYVRGFGLWSKKYIFLLNSKFDSETKIGKSETSHNSKNNHHITEIKGKC